MAGYHLQVLLMSAVFVLLIVLFIVAYAGSWNRLYIGTMVAIVATAATMTVLTRFGGGDAGPPGQD